MTPEDREARRIAHQAVARAIRQGEIIRPAAGCETCGTLHAHHRFGYDRPLDIVWLCASHHGMEHHNLRTGLATLVNDESVTPAITTDETWVRYHELVIAHAESRIAASKAQLTILRSRITRAKNRQEAIA